VTLTARDVAEITRLLEESSFDELHLEIDGLKLHLKRGAAVPAQPAQDPAVPAARPSAAAPVDPAAAPARPADRPLEAAIAVDPAVQNVSAPLLGTFYRAPKPGAPPFVEVGAHVEDDTIVGIIEVMKLMNTVRAGVRGTVTEILARDGALVEYGETLLRVRRMSEP
jgi:acetyl-CoA carboxylase biotin carboxyl carrier protein